MPLVRPLLLPALLALLGCGSSGCSRTPAAGGGGYQMPPLRVTTIEVVPRALPVTFTYPGRTEGSKEVEVRARTSGILKTRDFVEGEAVKVGQLLYTIDPDPLLAQQASARAELATAQARWVQADREAKRLALLVPDKAVSRRDADEATSSEQITAAAVATAKARLAEIDLNLSYTRVEAPVAGIAGRTLRSEGNLIMAGAEGLLTTVVQLDPLYAWFQRPESEQLAFERDVASGAIVIGDQGRGLTVEILDGKGQVLLGGGVLDFVAPHVARETGTVLLRATLPNPRLAVRAGQTCTVVLRGAVRNGVLAVPQAAVVEGARGKSVWVVRDVEGKPTAALCAIEVGDWVAMADAGPAGRLWIVRSGLTAGDRVITDHLVQLERMPPGAPIEPAPAAAEVRPQSGPETGR